MLLPALKKELPTIKKREAVAVPDEGLVKIPVIEESNHEENGVTPPVTKVANVPEIIH